jgi:hypothetical protein
MLAQLIDLLGVESGSGLRSASSQSRAVSSSSSSAAIAAAGVLCHTLGPSRSSMTARMGVPCARIRSMAWATNSPTIASPGR